MNQWIVPALILFAHATAQRAQRRRQNVNAPSGYPTSAPSSDPSAIPSSMPTQSPSVLPTQSPSVLPTADPTSQPVEITLSTWTDDHVLSFDADLGWKIYDSADELVDPCSNMLDCRREDDEGEAYYGPFSNAVDGMFLERRFACAHRSEVTLTFNIASCNVAGTKNEDSVTAWIFGTKVGKVQLQTAVSSSANNLMAVNGCSNFSSQSFERNTNEVFVEPDDKFSVEIRINVAGGDPTPSAYILGFSLSCDPTEDQSSADSADDAYIMHSAYCVEGLSDARFNGEYALMIDASEDAIDDANGQWAFAKQSFDGAAYLYELEMNNGSAWVVGAELNGADTVLECPNVAGLVTGPMEVHNQCYNQSQLAEGVMVEKGECVDHHTVIGDLNALTDLSLSRQLETELLSLVVVAVAVVFVMGMLACFCCAKCCTRTPYKHLEDSDESDAEV